MKIPARPTLPVARNHPIPAGFVSAAEGPVVVTVRTGIVLVAPFVKVTEVGAMEHLMPAVVDEAVQVRATDPLNPLAAEIVRELVPIPPGARLRAVGEATGALKSSTVNATAEECVVLPLVPVTVTL